MSGSKTRREFLITAGTGVAMGILSPRMGLVQGTSTSKSESTSLSGAATRTRRNVTSPMAQNDLISLRKGVAELKKLAVSQPNDPRGWILQAFLHGNCTKFTYCQHGNWYFAPWHRSLIYYFEQLIQQFSGNNDFALPYWDWSRTIGVPGSFYGAANPLDDDVSIKATCPTAPTAGRGRSASEQFSTEELKTYVGTDVINGIQQNPDFETYGGGNPGRGTLEGTPHNFIHRWVGGSKGSNMVRYFSPLDPIFWMHHCNIDRLYSNWLARSGHNPPPESEWQKKSFNDFYDRNGNRAGSEFTCGMTVDSRVMGYLYDQALDLPQELTARAQTAFKKEVVGSVASSKATSKAGVLSFVTDAAPLPKTRQFMNAVAADAAGYVVRLRIEGVKTPKNQNTGVHVFLGPDITADTPITAPGYVGSFTFFEGEGGGEGGGDGCGHAHGSGTLLLNASGALQELYGDTNLPEGANLSVSLITKPLFGGADAFATVEEIKPDRIQIDVVNLKA